MKYINYGLKGIMGLLSSVCTLSLFFINAIPFVYETYVCFFLSVDSAIGVPFNEIFDEVTLHSKSLLKNYADAESAITEVTATAVESKLSLNISISKTESYLEKLTNPSSDDSHYDINLENKLAAIRSLGPYVSSEELAEIRTTCSSAFKSSTDINLYNDIQSQFTKNLLNELKNILKLTQTTVETTLICNFNSDLYNQMELLKALQIKFNKPTIDENLPSLFNVLNSLENSLSEKNYQILICRDSVLNMTEAFTTFPNEKIKADPFFSEKCVLDSSYSFRNKISNFRCV